MSKLSNWKQERVRCVSCGSGYIRFTPFFGIKFKLFGRTYYYSGVNGWEVSRKKKKVY